MKRHPLCLPGVWLLATSGLVAGCDNQVSLEHRLTSLRMVLRSPMESELGSPTNPVTPATLKFDIEALDEKARRFRLMETCQRI